MTAVATWVLMPGMASAQTGSPPPPPVVAPQVLAQELPRTGSNVIPMLVVALALVALGIVAVLGARRRRTTDVTPA
ncbi:MAG: LPXTG cell wall anchor domain-containing protein [Acidimicrobiales bacterium]